MKFYWQSGTVRYSIIRDIVILFSLPFLQINLRIPVRTNRSADTGALIARPQLGINYSGRCLWSYAWPLFPQLRHLAKVIWRSHGGHVRRSLSVETAYGKILNGCRAILSAFGHHRWLREREREREREFYSQLHCRHTRRAMSPSKLVPILSNTYNEQYTKENIHRQRRNRQYGKNKHMKKTNCVHIQ